MISDNAHQVSPLVLSSCSRAAPELAKGDGGLADTGLMFYGRMDDGHGRDLATFVQHGVELHLRFLFR